MFSGSSLGWWESPGWLPQEQNPSFPWQLHLGWLLQMPSRSGAAQAPACSCATDRRTQAQRRQQPKQLLPRHCPVAAPQPVAAQPGAGTAGHRTAAIPHAFCWEPLLSRGLQSRLPRGKGTSGRCAELWGPRAKAHLPWPRLQRVSAKGGAACGGSRHCISLQAPTGSAPFI